MHEDLKDEVCRLNRALPASGLVTLTWGNISAIDRGAGIVAMKPSGVGYDALSPDDIVLLDLEGNVVDGTLNPSSDTATHLALYRAWRSGAGTCPTPTVPHGHGVRPGRA